jgi:PBSX family phage terminase large subunit
MALSVKQVATIDQSYSRMNLWVGAVRASKTVASLYRWIIFVASEAPPDPLLIIGKTQDTAVRNIIKPLQDLIGSSCRWYSGKRECWIFDRCCFVLGANDETSEGKIRGMTCGGALGDELTLWPESFWTMLLSRCSPEGAKIFGTTNPDSPYHYLYTNYIKRVDDLDITVHNFCLDDNPFLSQAFKDNLRKEYRGLWFKRFIQGLWVLAEGTVYDFFDEKEHVLLRPPGSAEKYLVGIDHGTANPTCFLLFGVNRHLRPWIWIEREYYYDSVEVGRQKDDAEYVDDFETFLNGIKPAQVILDPSAASFKAALRKRARWNLVDAKNDVLEGIRLQSRMLNSGEYGVCQNCFHTINEYGAYLWDANAQKRGEDKPLKQHDHTKDAERYVLNTYAGDTMLDYTKLTQR